MIKKTISTRDVAKKVQANYFESFEKTAAIFK